jgi:hypothetical protein
LMAIEDINKAGIKSLGGAKLDVLLGDAQSTPQAGTAEVEKMNEAGCSADRRRLRLGDLPGHHAGGRQARPAARGGHRRGRPDRAARAEEHLPLRPRLRTCAQVAVNNLHVLNTVAGKPAKTVMIIHEESLFGTGTANLLARELPGFGFEVKEVVKHANPTRDFNNIVLRMKSVNPDIVIPANYYNEYALLVRTMQQQKVVPKAIYSVLGGAASSYKFLKEFPDAANGIIDCNHWFNPKDKRAAELRKRVEAKGLFFTYESLQHLHRGAAAGRRDRQGKECRPRRHHRRAGRQHLQRPLHAVRPDEVRRRPEHRRAAADDAGAQGRHQGHRAARLPRGFPVEVPKCLSAEGLSGPARGSAARACRRAVLEFSTSSSRPSWAG